MATSLVSACGPSGWCDTLHARGNIEDSASYLGVPTRVVRAAVSYYAEFAGEIDADAEWAARIESAERARWEREQAALA